MYKISPTAEILPNRIGLYVQDLTWRQHDTKSRWLDHKSEKAISKKQFSWSYLFTKKQANQMPDFATWSRVARFFLVQNTKTGKIYQITTKYTKSPQHMPKDCKMDEMPIKYSKLNCKTLQNLPKFGFLVWKHTIWQPWHKVSFFVSSSFE
jgi:hypothetical protein